MSNLSISQLPSSSGLTGTEVLPIVQSGTTVQTTVQDVADLSSVDLSEVSEDIIPLFDGVYDIGTEEKKWYDGFFTNKVQIGTSSIQTDIDDDLTINTNLIVQGTVSSEIGDFGDITISGNTISKIFDEYGGGDETIIVEGDLDIVGEILQNGVPLSLGVTQEGTGTRSTIRIDNNNNASGNYSTVSGGHSNTASGLSSTIGGGGGFLFGTGGNLASGNYSTVGGGRFNTSSCLSSTIGGGTSNTSNGYASTIGGGLSNTSSGQYSTIAGGRGNTSSYCFSTVGGGYFNTACGVNSTVGGGSRNTASGFNSTIGGGCNNIACNTNSTIGGGRQNNISANYAVIAGGFGNTASGIYSAILGGKSNNTAGCNCAMIVGFGITADMCNTTFVNCLSIKNIPTSSLGLCSGMVYSELGTLKIVS